MPGQSSRDKPLLEHLVEKVADGVSCPKKKSLTGIPRMG